MIKYLFLLTLPSLVMACTQNSENKGHAVAHKQNFTQVIYSKDVSDSFSIFVNLPNDYNSEQPTKYPVVYLLDANLYFDIMATTINKYSEVGLAPSVILVGIGYKDLLTMDSLRNRDYTYPLAFPEYEMGVSGGANKFLTFLKRNLLPVIDKEYNTDTLQRVLAGHSLGGYFVIYALNQNLSGKDHSFSSYIAASPSLHYNKYYLLNQVKETSHQKDNSKKIRAYITFGGLEDEEEEDPGIMKLSEVSSQLSKVLTDKQSNYLIYKSEIFSNLGHMDIQIPTFIKGLQWSFNEGK